GAVREPAPTGGTGKPAGGSGEPPPPPRQRQQQQQQQQVGVRLPDHQEQPPLPPSQRQQQQAHQQQQMKVSPVKQKAPAVKPAGRDKSGQERFEIPEKAFKGREKVEGSPGSTNVKDAQREALAAQRAAEREDSTRGLLEDDAKDYVGAKKGNKCPDVIAKLNDGSHIMAEGKGTDAPKAIEQFREAGQL